MSDIPGSTAVAPLDLAPAPQPDIDTLVDRERRNPHLRYLIHYIAPIGASLLAHVVILSGLGLTGWAVMQQSKIDVGDFEAGITESLADKMAEGFKWPDEEKLETPEPDLEKLDKLTDLSDLTRDDVDLKPAEGLGDAESGLGLGEGRGDILGIGSGAGGPGSGGWGSGLGGGQRAGGSAGIWGADVIANKIAFVIDYSGSIIVAQEDLVRELKRSISRLKPFQSFNVIIFYSTQGGSGAKVVTESFAQALQSATQVAKKNFYDWVAGKAPQGSTEPLEALRRAFSMEPEAIFFLSDGYFDDSIVDEIKKRNKGRVKVCCLVFDEQILQDPAGGTRQTDGARRLQRIATENNGIFKIVTGADLAK